VALTKVRGAGAEGLTLSSTALAIANGLTLTDGNVTLASGHGIDFAPTGDASGMASELLDDYEQGTFTPSITFGGGSTGIAYFSGRQSGIYTKIGNCVNISIHLQMTSKGSSTGSVQVTGLPYTSDSNDHYIPSAVWIMSMASMSGGFPTFRVFPNATYMDGHQLSSNTYSALTNSNCTDTTAFQINVKYFVA